jgi:hypothetical protein
LAAAWHGGPVHENAEKALAGAPEATGPLARRLCERILALFPGAVVTTDGRDIGFGFSPGYKGLVFVVTPHRAHVTLGISHGVGLPDPAGLMEGAGKVHRHVKLRTDADLDRPELQTLLTTALTNRTPD